MYRQRLTDLGVSDEDLSSIDKEVAEIVDEATDYAKASPEPDPESAFTDVWADGSGRWRN